MNELEVMKKLVSVLTHQRNFALDQLAQVETTLVMEREAAVAKERDAAEPAPLPNKPHKG
jgi:hypothetical protein